MAEDTNTLLLGFKKNKPQPGFDCIIGLMSLCFYLNYQSRRCQEGAFPRIKNKIYIYITHQTDKRVFAVALATITRTELHFTDEVPHYSLR